MNLYNHDFENSIIGAIMIDPSCLFDVMPIITPKTFSSGFCRAAYTSALDLDKNGVEIDVVSLSDHLERTEPDNEWFTWLATIAKSFFSSRSVVAHAKAIREYEEMRNLLNAGQSIIDVCTDPDMTLANKIDHAQQSILDLQAEKETGPSMPKELLKSFVDHVEMCSKSEGGLTGMATGFPAFDNACKGLHPGDLIIIAARPGMGKTNLALNIASNSVNNGKNILLFTLEMTKDEVMGRLCAARSMLSYDRVLSADFTPDEWPHFTTFVETFNQTGFAIDDDSTLSVADVRSRARKHKMQHGLDLIVVDYLQLLDGPGDNLTEKTSNISTALKRLAKDMGVPVIALSQLNRSLENRTDKRPIMSDLRQSGAIEQDANIILFLYRDVIYNKNCDYQHLAELDIAKLRHGKIQTLTLETQFDKCRFLPTDQVAQGFVADEPKKQSSFASRQRG